MSDQRYSSSDCHGPTISLWRNHTTHLKGFLVFKSPPVKCHFSWQSCSTFQYYWHLEAEKFLALQGCLMRYRMVSSISAICPLKASSSSPPSDDNQKYLQHCQMSPGRQNCPFTPIEAHCPRKYYTLGWGQLCWPMNSNPLSGGTDLPTMQLSEEWQTTEEAAWQLPANFIAYTSCGWQWGGRCPLQLKSRNQTISVHERSWEREGGESEYAKSQPPNFTWACKRMAKLNPFFLGIAFSKKRVWLMIYWSIKCL